MWLYILACVVLGLAVLLAILCHPAIFFGGRPIYGPFGAFYDLYFILQWLAAWMTIASGVMFMLLLRAWPVPKRHWIGPPVAALLLLYLVMNGFPHRRNRLTWCNGDLGLAAYLRAAFSKYPAR